MGISMDFRVPSGCGIDMYCKMSWMDSVLTSKGVLH